MRKQIGKMAFLCMVGVVQLAQFMAIGATAAEQPLMFHASWSGTQTLDTGDAGGNPFASAFVQVLGMKSVNLTQAAQHLQRLTFHKSKGFQLTDGPIDVPNWSLRPKAKSEKRLALVLIVWDYSISGRQSLPGARLDALRVSKALQNAGFETELALDPSLERMRDSLARFSAKSANFDVAAIYTTGHGVEVAGRVYLLPGSFPRGSGRNALGGQALPLSEIAASSKARNFNLVFYAGCRDDPFTH